MRVVFGAFTLDLDRRELYRQDRVQPLEPKAFSVLAYLLTHRDRAIAKEELLAACWPGEFVTDAALARCVQVIRRAVADDGGQQQVIKTLRGYGYRFVAMVETLPAPAAALPRGQVPSSLPASAGALTEGPSAGAAVELLGGAAPPLPLPCLVRSVRRPIGLRGSSVPRVARRSGPGARGAAAAAPARLLPGAVAAGS
jgi:DNA-binding winged helix-turn-helix (wHTH) protein